MLPFRPNDLCLFVCDDDDDDLFLPSDIVGLRTSLENVSHLRLGTVFGSAPRVFVLISQTALSFPTWWCHKRTSHRFVFCFSFI